MIQLHLMSGARESILSIRLKCSLSCAKTRWKSTKIPVDLYLGNLFLGFNLVHLVMISTSALLCPRADPYIRTSKSASSYTTVENIYNQFVHDERRAKIKTFLQFPKTFLHSNIGIHVAEENVVGLGSAKAPLEVVHCGNDWLRSLVIVACILFGLCQALALLDLGETDDDAWLRVKIGTGHVLRVTGRDGKF